MSFLDLCYLRACQLKCIRELAQPASSMIVPSIAIRKGVIAIGQLALAYTFGIGQFVTGYTAIGQFAFGKYVLAQIGFGEFVWDMKHAAPEAKEYFLSLLKLH